MSTCSLYSKDISRNFVGTTNDSTIGAIACNTQTTTNFKSYTASSLPSFGGTFNTLSDDASCCYIVNTADSSGCEDYKWTIQGGTISGSLTEVSNYTISGDITELNGSTLSILNGGTKISVCSVDPASMGVSSLGGNIGSGYSGLQSQVGDISANAGKLGGFNGLALIVLGGIASLMVYILFLIGPFIFWTKFAPNTVITGEKNCNRGRTILDRYYSYNNDRLPYNFKLYKTCRPGKLKPLVLDKCMNEADMSGLQNKLAKGTGDVWSKVEYLLRGFPYNMINCNKEKLLKCYEGAPFLIFSLVFSSFAYLILMMNKQHSVSDFNPLSPESWGNLLGGMLLAPLAFTALVAAICLLYFKINNKTTIIMFVVQVIVMILGCFLSGYVAESSGTNKTVADGAWDAKNNVFNIIITVIFFLAFAFGSNNYTTTGKNYDFRMVFIKGAYYFSKYLLIKPYKGAAMKSRKAINKLVRFVGKLPLPNWVWVIFGSVIIPIFVIFLLLIRYAFSIWGGFTGTFTSFGATLKSNKINKCNKDPDDVNDPNQKPKMTIPAVKKSASERVGRFGKYVTTKGKEAKKAVYNFVTKSDYRDQDRIDDPHKDCGQSLGPGVTIILLISILPVVMPFLFAFINVIFQFFSWFLIPLTYPKIFVNVLSCNMKSFILLLGIGIISTLHNLNGGSKGIFVPEGTLNWMTITFALIALWNIFSK